MSVIDNDITAWSTTKASNSPTEGAPILRDLAKQFRNVKSVSRAESLRKHQEQPTEGATFGFVDAETASFTGTDMDEILQIGRKIYAYGPSFAERVGWIIDATNTGGSDWLAAISWITDPWTEDADEVRFGAPRLSPPALPLTILRGRLIYNDETRDETVSVTFRDVNGNTMSLRDTAYMLRIQPVRFGTDRSLMIIKQVEKSTSGFTFTIGGSEVLGADDFVEYEWVIVAQPWW